MSKFTEGSIKNISALSTKVGFVLAKEGLIRSYREKIFDFDAVITDTEIAKSYLGTPVYSNLIFGDLNDPNKNIYLDIDGTLNTFSALQINDVILEVHQPKTRIKTSMQGRKGTIKQYVCDGDYLITATGRITRTKNMFNYNQYMYPEQGVLRLIQICSIPDSIPVTCGFLQMFDIYNVVIDEYRIPQEQGKSCEQYFELTMSSDEEIDLENVT